MDPKQIKSTVAGVRPDSERIRTPKFVTKIVTPGAEPEPAAEPKADEPPAKQKIGVRQVLLSIGTFFAVIAILVHFAPRDMNRPVSTTVATPGAASGSPCGYAGPVVKAVETNNAGPYTLYHIWCANGLNFDIAR